MTHITGGMVALLTGPWQFWTGFRMELPRSIAGPADFRMRSALGWIWCATSDYRHNARMGIGISLFGLVLTWSTTSATT